MPKSEQFPSFSAKCESGVEKMTSILEAREILGHDVMGPEEIEKAFGFKPNKEYPIPYSKEDLEKAKQLGEMLVLRTDQDAEGQTLTMHALCTNPILRQAAKDAGGMFLFDFTDPNHRKVTNEGYFLQDAPRTGWKLVSKEAIPDAPGTLDDYVNQTRKLRDHLQKNDCLLSGEFTECSDDRLAELDVLVVQDERAAARQLAELAVNRNHRRTAVEVLYDTALMFGGTGEILLRAYADWTSTVDSNGKIVKISGGGLAGGDGMIIRSLPPSFKNWQLRACYQH
jgi:hypothetical protein